MLGMSYLSEGGDFTTGTICIKKGERKGSVTSCLPSIIFPDLSEASVHAYYLKYVNSFLLIVYQEAA